MDQIIFGKPIFTPEEIAEVGKIFESGWVGMGPKVKEFEGDFARYTGATYAVAVSSCTAALHIALKSLGVGPGDEVITTAMTFAATINAILMSGATPVLVDCDPVYRNINLDQVEKAITKKTKVIMPVHFAGAPNDLDRIAAMKQKFGVKIVYDCAHAIESEWNGVKVGAGADLCCFSFYATKNITTIEGGMICTPDPDLSKRLTLLRHHGMTQDAWKRFSATGYKHYNIETLGYKYNMTDVQAGLGIMQLRRIEERYTRREQIWSRFEEAWADLPIDLPQRPKSPHRHALHLFAIQVPDRDRWLEKLQNVQVGCGVHYRAIPTLKYFHEHLGWNPTDFPVALNYGDRTLSLPLTPFMSDDQVDHVISSVKAVAKETL